MQPGCLLAPREKQGGQQWQPSLLPVEDLRCSTEGMDAIGDETDKGFLAASPTQPTHQMLPAFSVCVIPGSPVKALPLRRPQFLHNFSLHPESVIAAHLCSNICE